MEDDELVRRALAGDVAAFTDLVRRHQGMAFGYALANLRDFQLAEDATQEAFVAAYFALATLAEPRRFPAWLRGIVRHQCGRLRRRRRLATVALEAGARLPDRGPTPHQFVEENDGVAPILAALDALPAALRAVAVLAYAQGYAQREIAAFLALPATTVNNRLAAARRHLREGRQSMTNDAFGPHALPEDFAAQVGAIVRTRGPLIEARFAPDAQPAVLNGLTLGAAPGAAALATSVIQHLPDGEVRGLVLAPLTDPGAGIRLGAAITDTARPLDAAADVATIAAALAALRPAPGDPPTVLETGIKVLDLLCPFPRRGLVGLFGDKGAGKAVLLAELLRNITGPEARLTIATFIQAGEEVAFFQPYVQASSAQVAACYLPADQAAALATADVAAQLDAHLALSKELVALRLFPAVDPASARSRLLDPAIVGEEHYRVAAATRALLAAYPESAAPGDDVSAHRARKLRRFLSQPLFIAADYAHIPGAFVSRAETVRGCAAILRGDHDDRPEGDLYMIGPIGQAGVRNERGDDAGA